MPQEVITLVVSAAVVPQPGALDARPLTAVGSADVQRRSSAQRAVRAGALVVGGLATGTICIVIPIVHLVTTWALPLLGVLLAVREMRREVVITRLEGQCPACEAMIDERDRGRDDPAVQVCPHCNRRLQIVFG